MIKRRTAAATCVSALLLMLQISVGHAQSWPTHPIKILVGLAAGGGTDATARIVANELTKRLGQPVLVENRPGGGTTIAAAATAKALPDGYTLFMASSSYATSAATIKGLTFDPYRDLRAVAQVTSVPFCIVAHPSVPVGTMVELIALAKARPHDLSYASSGIGGAGHLGGELLKGMAGIDLVHIPYRGSAPALTDLIAGRVQFLISDLYSVQARAKAGELKIIAVTSKSRAESAPNVPTVSESGLPGYAFSGWAGLLAPVGVPDAIVQRLNHDVAEILKNPETVATMKTQGAELVSFTPDDFQRLITSELKLWREVAERSNIKAE